MQAAVSLEGLLFFIIIMFYWRSPFLSTGSPSATRGHVTIVIVLIWITFIYVYTFKSIIAELSLSFIHTNIQKFDF